MLISTTEKVLGWQSVLSIKDIVADEPNGRRLNLRNYYNESILQLG